MRHAAASLLALLLLIPVPAPAQNAAAMQATYDLYAAGFHIADMQAAFGVGAQGYDIQVEYHTAGVVGLFNSGHTVSSVTGTWDADRPAPHRFQSIGVWQGEHRMTLIDYLHGEPLVRTLEPQQENVREPVPLPLRRNAIDLLSALALLVHHAADTGRCETSVHTFDGLRYSELTARTAGWEILPPSSRSIFSGKALRCDFVGQMQAGFLYEDSAPFDHRPLHGAVWLAGVMPGAPPLPVQMQFATRWFGEATMHLTQIGQSPATEIAAH